MRKNLFEYDQVLNTQRDKVYSLRRQALLEPDLSEQLLDFSARTMDDILEVCTPCVSQAARVSAMPALLNPQGPPGASFHQRAAGVQLVVHCCPSKWTGHSPSP